MTPSTHLEAPPETEVLQRNNVGTLVLEPPQPTPERSKPSPVVPRQFEDGSFRSSMIESNRMKNDSRGLNFAISLLLNLTVLTVPVLAGLYFTDTLNLKQFATTFLIAPPPPPPPPPAPAVAAVKAPPAHRVFENAGKLLAPTVIPQKIAQIKEAPLPGDAGLDGVIGGVPGGVAGGSMGGVIGGVIGGVRTTADAPVAPKEVKSKTPVRVGGHIREPKLIRRVDPIYPALARQTHMQGVVLIEAVIDERGNVVEMKVVSGPPLLIQAAVTAVSQWKYEPTYLNEEPVPVAMSVTVTFQLSQQ